MAGLVKLQGGIGVIDRGRSWAESENQMALADASAISPP